MFSIKNIVYSRFLYWKNRKKPWYKERRQICEACPLNSKKTKNKSWIDKILSILYLKKPHCTVCKCPIQFITALPENECSDFNNLKWKSIL